MRSSSWIVCPSTSRAHRAAVAAEAVDVAGQEAIAVDPGDEPLADLDERHQPVGPLSASISVHSMTPTGSRSARNGHGER
jgi:hypothetical protein